MKMVIKYDDAAKRAFKSKVNWPNVPLDLVDSVNGRQYLRKKLLGEGGFAKVYRVIEKSTNREFACKAVYKDPRQKNPFTPKVMEQDNNFVYILTELCPYGTLSDLIRSRKQLGEQDCRFLMSQLLDALFYFRQMGVLHRDLKLGNLLISKDKELRVADFGLTVMLDDLNQRRKTLCGTPNYLAPEMIVAKESTGYSFQADLWSFGVIFFNLLFSTQPFKHRDPKGLMKKIQECDLQFPPTRKISHHATDLLQKILVQDPNKRLSLEEVKSHSFFSGGYTPMYLSETLFDIPPQFSQEALENEPSAKRHKSLDRRDQLTLANENILAQNKKAQMDHSVKDNGLLKAGDTTEIKPKIEVVNLDDEESLTEINPEPLTKAVVKIPKVKPNKVQAQDISTPTNTESSSKPDDFNPLTENEIPLPDVILDLWRSFLLIESKISTKTTLTNSVKSEDKSVPNFVIKRADYTGKYGLAYELIDGTVGVYFRDFTTMLLASDQTIMSYIFSSPTQTNIQQTFTTVPSSLKKKSVILTKYRMFMSENLEGLTPDSSLTKMVDVSEKLVYVYDRFEKDGMELFCLSNDLLQINFTSTGHTYLLSDSACTLTIIVNNDSVHQFSLEYVFSKGFRTHLTNTKELVHGEVFRAIKQVHGLIKALFVRND